MAENINLKEMEKKAFRDSNQDGLMEIIFGIFLFAIAGYIGTGDFPILLILLPTFGPIWMQIIRNKFTYPRIGYAKPSLKISKKIVLSVFLYMFVVISIVILVPIVGDIWDLSLFYNWSPGFLGILTIVVFFYIGFRLGSFRYYIFSALSLVGFFSLFFINFDTIKRGLEMYFLFMSSFLIISGFIFFIHFLRKYPVQSEELPDGV